ncbi:MAG: hypothetical protein NUV80_01065 [Candidatus Berkelbacteria bacterium]|nr:hypothetical protein [Candidatus Berkelbacteria bacterium]
MIRGFDELSDNNQLRILEISVFLKIASGNISPETSVASELVQLSKTPQEWRKFRKDLFEKANEIREKMGLRRLGA